jgi:hypothetical protein
MRVAQLESTYRRAAAVYPRSWREEQGDELVGVLLDVAAGQGRTKATIGELVNVVVLGLATRCSFAFGRISAARRDTIAGTATVLVTYLAVALLLLGEWGPWIRPGSLRWRPTGEGFSERLANFGPFTSLAALVCLGILAAFLAVVFHRPRIQRPVMLIVAALSVVLPALSDLANVLAPPPPVMFIVAGLALLTLVGRPGRSRPRRYWIGAGAPLLSAAGLALAVWSIPGKALFFYNATSVVSVDSQSLAFGTGLMMLTALAVLAAREMWFPVACALACATLPYTTRLLLSIPVTAEDFRLVVIASAVLAVPVAAAAFWQGQRSRSHAKLFIPAT